MQKFSVHALKQSLNHNVRACGVGSLLWVRAPSEIGITVRSEVELTWELRGPSYPAVIEFISFIFFFANEELSLTMSLELSVVAGSEVLSYRFGLVKVCVVHVQCDPVWDVWSGILYSTMHDGWMGVCGHAFKWEEHWLMASRFKYSTRSSDEVVGVHLRGCCRAVTCR